MSFGNQYIEKYGQKALETYKRSLKHSDVTEIDVQQSPQKKKLRNSKSTSRKNLSIKSNKSSLNQQSRQLPTKSFMYTTSNRGKGQPFNALQLSINPTKKKLMISDLATPKGTPSKTIGIKNDRKISGGTNVNVYVQAINRSKSKESSPGKKFKSSKYSKIKNNSGKTVAKVISLLNDQELRLKNKNISKAHDLLVDLQSQIFQQDKNRQKIELKFMKMKQIIEESQEHINFSEQAIYKDRIGQLQAQLNRYREKEQILIRIVESLTSKNQRQKRSECEGPITSEQQDEGDEMN